MDEEEDHFEAVMAEDWRQVNNALDGLIDSISRLKATENLAELDIDDLFAANYAVDHANFVIKGLMFQNSLNYFEDGCGSCEACQEEAARAAEEDID